MEEDRKARARDRATTVGAIIFDILGIAFIIGIIIFVVGLFVNANEGERETIVTNNETANISAEGFDYTPAEIIFNGKTYRLVE